MGLMPSTWKATVRIKHFSSHAWYVVGKEELEGRGNDGVCDSHSLSRGNIKNSHLEITEKPVTRQALFLCTVNIKFSVPRGSQSRCTPSGGTEAPQCLVTRKLQQDPQCGQSVVPRLPRADL